MTQGMAYVALYVLGLLFQLGFGPRAQPALCCALGFLTGLALWVLGTAVVIATPLPYDDTTAIAAYFVPLAIAGTAAARRWRPGRRELVTIAAWTAASALLYLTFDHFDASRFSADSKHIVRSALELPDTKDLRYLSGKGGFALIAHSMARFLSADYCYALNEAIGFALTPLFVLCGWRGLARLGADGCGARLLVVVTAAATATTYNYLWHHIYIHNNLGSAVYLFAFAAMFWLAELEQEVAYLPGAFVFLAAYTLHRLEAPVFAVVLVLITVYPSRLPRRALTIGLAAFTIACAVWHAAVLVVVPRMSATRADAIAVVMIGLLAGWLVLSRTRWIVHARHLPRALVAALVLVLVYGYFTRYAAFDRSRGALDDNLLGHRLHMWGYTWDAVLALTALSWIAPPVPSGRILSYAAVLSFLLVCALGLEHPWRVGLTDSANRMMLQVLPVAMFYFAMQFAPLFTPAPEP